MKLVTMLEVRIEFGTDIGIALLELHRVLKEAESLQSGLCQIIVGVSKVETGTGEEHDGQDSEVAEGSGAGVQGTQEAHERDDGSGQPRYRGVFPRPTFRNRGQEAGRIHASGKEDVTVYSRGRMGCSGSPDVERRDEPRGGKCSLHTTPGVRCEWNIAGYCSCKSDCQWKIEGD